jgi:hypothetical protein
MTGGTPGPGGENRVFLADEAADIFTGLDAHDREEVTQRVAEILRAGRKTFTYPLALDPNGPRVQYGTLEDLEQAATRERDQQAAGET